jgi:hypothetical protein
MADQSNPELYWVRLIRFESLEPDCHRYELLRLRRPHVSLFGKPSKNKGSETQQWRYLFSPKWVFQNH